MCIAKIRRYRVKLLGRQRKVDAVADILRHSQHVVERQAAIEALTNSGDRRAVDLLIGALSDNDALVRATAAAGLGFLRDARAIAPLIGVLSGHPVVGAIAARSLVNIGAPAVEPLVAALRSYDTIVRFAAAMALGELRDSRAEAGLTAATRDHDSDVRRVASEALEMIRGTRSKWS